MHGLLIPKIKNSEELKTPAIQLIDHDAAQKDENKNVRKAKQDIRLQAINVEL